ncbi:MAG: FkbM family methyltransferase, partial [Gammaproteobacteria bacterium]
YRGHPNLIFENAAISDREEQRTLFRIREDCDYLPQWCAGLGSFHREVLLSHRWAIPDLERYVVEEIVHCVTLSSLLRKHAVTRVDVLCIDTEGHDHEILRQIHFESVRPRVLLYEHEYMRRVERERCEAMLAGRGYALSRRLGDTLAYLPF